MELYKLMRTVKLIPMALTLCFIVSSLFAHKEILFSQLEEPYKSWHLDLFDRVMQATANLDERKLTNFFAVKIVIEFKNGEQRISDIKSYSSSNQSVDDIHQLISSSFICDNPKDVTTFNKNIQTGETQQEKLQIKIFKENYFTSKKLNYINEIKDKNTDDTVCKILTTLSTFQENLFLKKLANYCLNESNPFRLSDSEMVFLQQIINGKFIILTENEPMDFKQLIQSKESISRIEIHGFTTRDMCPCCYQHMKNAIQWLRYNYKIPVFAYISSLVKLSGDTLKFVPYGLTDTLDEGRDGLTCIFFRKEYDTNFIFENAKQLARTLNLLKRDDNSIEEVFSIVNMLDEVLIEIIEEDGVQSYIQNTDFSKTQQISLEPHQQSIADQIRSQGFEIRNVTDDGNCGAYALLQGLAYNENARNQAMLANNLTLQDIPNNFPAEGYNSVQQNDVIWNAAVALRQLLSVNNPRREMATSREINRWITDDDLQTFSNALDINIVLISEQNGNRIFMPNGENNPAQQQTLEGVLNFARENNAVILYHNFNHYQTVTNVQIQQ